MDGTTATTHDLVYYEPRTICSHGLSIHASCFAAPVRSTAALDGFLQRLKPLLSERCYLNIYPLPHTGEHTKLFTLTLTCQQKNWKTGMTELAQAEQKLVTKANAEFGTAYQTVSELFAGELAQAYGTTIRPRDCGHLIALDHSTHWLSQRIHDDIQAAKAASAEHLR